MATSRICRTRLFASSFFSLLVPALAAAQVVDYSGHQAVRVHVDSPQDIARIEAAGGELLTCCPRPGLVDVRVPPGGLDRLVETGLAVKLVSADIGPAMSRHLHRAVGAGPFDDYMPLAELEQFAHDLAALRPDLCNVTTIGFSLQNRPIVVMHITGPTGGDKPGVFYHGLQHAREWITGPTVMYLANHLLTHYDTDPCIQDLVDRTHIYLSPCVNPDGYAYTWTNNRLWRKNRRHNGSGIYGVDLNRNWAFGWGGEGASSSPSNETYRGTGPFSEPETQVLSSFMSSHPEIRAYMDYHSYSQLILWPYGFTSSEPSEPDRGTFYAVGNRMQELIQSIHGEYYEPGPIYTTIYPASGGSVDWAYGARGIFGFTIELRPVSFSPGFELPPEEIIPTCEENLPAILHLTEFASSDLQIASSSSALVQMTAGVVSPVTANVQVFAGAVVAGSVKVHYRYAAGAEFTELIMTPAGGGDYVANLPATHCASQPEVYFSAESTTGQLMTHPCGAPTNTYAPSIASNAATFYSEPMNSNPGWTTQGLWAWGQPTGGGGEYGGPDPTSGHTGANVYGYNLNGDYSNSMVEQHLTSTAINCAGRSGVRLSFWRWLGVEQSIYDHAYVRVSNNGVNWTTVWQNVGTISDTAWTYQEFDISAIADNQPTVYLRWTMGSTDGAWRYCGWNIDDVKLSTGECPTLPGDHNGDLQLDLADFVAFPPCVLGPDGGVAPGCGIFDFDLDSNIDMDDAAEFQRLIAP